MKLLIIALLFSLSVNAQKDSVKKDTVVIVLIERTDTASATIIYLAKNGDVKHREGYALLHGRGKEDKGKFQWIEVPKIIGYLDDRKQVIKQRVIQAF